MQPVPPQPSAARSRRPASRRTGPSAPAPPARRPPRPPPSPASPPHPSRHRSRPRPYGPACPHPAPWKRNAAPPKATTPRHPGPTRSRARPAPRSPAPAAPPDPPAPAPPRSRPRARRKARPSAGRQPRRQPADACAALQRRRIHQPHRTPENGPAQRRSPAVTQPDRRPAQPQRHGNRPGRGSRVTRCSRVVKACHPAMKQEPPPPSPTPRSIKGFENPVEPTGPHGPPYARHGQLPPQTSTGPPRTSGQTIAIPAPLSLAQARPEIALPRRHRGRLPDPGQGRHGLRPLRLRQARWTRSPPRAFMARRGSSSSPPP